MQAATEIAEDIAGAEGAGTTPATPVPNPVHQLKIDVMQHRLTRPPDVELTVRPEQHGGMVARTPLVQDTNPRGQINLGSARFEPRYRGTCQLLV